MINRPGDIVRELRYVALNRTIEESYYSHGDDEEPDFDNPPVLTQETADSELYNWAMNEAKEDLVTYTYDEISKMGWEEFVKKSA